MAECAEKYSGPYQEDLLSTICWAWGGASCLACLSVLLGWLRMPSHTRPTLNDASSMILFLTASDLCLGLDTLLEGSTSAVCSPGLCIFKACVAQFFGLSSFLWSAAISHSSYKQVAQIFLTFSQVHVRSTGGSAEQSSSWTMMQYHALCWGLPFFSTVFMLATLSAGPSGSHFCWIATDREDNASVLPLYLAIVLYLLPLALVEVYHLVVFRFLAKTLGQIPTSGILLKKFTRVLTILITTKTLLLLARTLRLFVPANTVFAIGVFSVIGAPLQGLGDYLIFNRAAAGAPQTQYEAISSSRGSVSGSSGRAVVVGLGAGAGAGVRAGAGVGGSETIGAPPRRLALAVEMSPTYNPLGETRGAGGDSLEADDVDADEQRGRHYSSAALLGGDDTGDVGGRTNSV